MPDSAQPEVVAGALLGLLAIWTLIGRRWFRPRRRGPVPARSRCAAHQDKVIFQTEREAQEFVDWTRRRHAAGRWSGLPMDHSYQCPERATRHWHVSSKPRRTR